jgi:hypothetical protein
VHEDELVLSSGSLNTGIVERLPGHRAVDKALDEGACTLGGAVLEGGEVLGTWGSTLPGNGTQGLGRSCELGSAQHGVAWGLRQALKVVATAARAERRQEAR